MPSKTITIALVKAAASQAGGKVLSDGCGGYDLIAPDGKRWTWAEAWCQPIPLSEAGTQEERHEMLQWAYECATGGLTDMTPEPFYNPVVVSLTKPERDWVDWALTGPVAEWADNVVEVERLCHEWDAQFPPAQPPGAD